MHTTTKLAARYTQSADRVVYADGFAVVLCSVRAARSTAGCDSGRVFCATTTLFFVPTSTRTWVKCSCNQSIISLTL